MKANPAFSMEDYLWKISVPLARLMAADATQVVYLSEAQQKRYRDMKRHKLKDASGITDDPEEFACALGIPSFD